MIRQVYCSGVQCMYICTQFIIVYLESAMNVADDGSEVRVYLLFLL